jgi:hypothetical protein
MSNFPDVRSVRLELGAPCVKASTNTRLDSASSEGRFGVQVPHLLYRFAGRRPVASA